MDSSHKISKLIFEVSMEGDENQVKVLQSEIEVLFSKYIAEVLDTSLGKFDDESVDFVIDKLEVDIGSFDLKHGKDKLFKEISEKVEEEIRKLSKSSGNQKELSVIQSKKKDVSELELVFYILRNGHLPWWADFNKKVNVNAIFKIFIQRPNNKEITRLKNELINPVFRKRLINYLSEDKLIDCVKILIPLLINENKLLIETCKTSLHFKEHFFGLLLQLPNQTSSNHIEEIIETTLELLQEHKISPKTIILEGLPIPKKILSRLAFMQLSIGKTKDVISIDSKEKTQKETKKKEFDTDSKEKIENYNSDETENSIEITNAGLILILSFLSRFFENIGIAKNRKFNSEVEQHYAVYLLHYIATGNQVLPQEHELFFEKLICGIEVNEVLKPCFTLDKSHLDEVMELLKSVIENWKALKNSSPLTLQMAFLQRPGYLIQRDDGAWSLHIERQTIDILLDRIPWTISISKLPFNDLMIYTEW